MITNEGRDVVAKAWEEKNTEPLVLGVPLRGPEIEKYKKEHPVMSEEEALEIIRASQEG